MKTRPSPTDPAETRHPAVVEWRRTQLLAAGFPPGEADGLAHDCGVDLHDLLDLVEQGSPPELAARILAPLDDESRVC